MKESERKNPTTNGYDKHSWARICWQTFYFHLPSYIKTWTGNLKQHLSINHCCLSKLVFKSICDWISYKFGFVCCCYTERSIICNCTPCAYHPVIFIYCLKYLQHNQHKILRNLHSPYVKTGFDNYKLASLMVTSVPKITVVFCIVSDCVN